MESLEKNFKFNQKLTYKIQQSRACANPRIFSQFIDTLQMKVLFQQSLIDYADFFRAST